ncbi:hypothetical protein RCL1_000076 [Eukaryota sp. TZLM3-RCL]
MSSSQNPLRGSLLTITTNTLRWRDLANHISSLHSCIDAPSVCHRNFSQKLKDGEVVTVPESKKLLTCANDPSRYPSWEHYLLDSFPVVIYNFQDESLILPMAIDDLLYTAAQLHHQVGVQHRLRYGEKISRGSYCCSICGGHGHTKSKCQKRNPVFQSCPVDLFKTEPQPLVSPARKRRRD